MVKQSGTRYRAKFGADPKIDHSYAYCYDALLMLADAYRGVGPTVIRQSRRDAIAATKNLKATTGTLSGDVPEPTRSSVPLVKLQNGNWVSLR